MKSFLQEQYENICEGYIRSFSTKHKLGFEGWIGDFVGGIAVFADYYNIHFDDIRYDVDSNTPERLILKWYEDKEKLNFRHYCKKHKYDGPRTYNNPEESQ